MIENVLFSDTRFVQASMDDGRSETSDYGLLLQSLLPNQIQPGKVENLITIDSDSDSDEPDWNRDEDQANDEPSDLEVVDPGMMLVEGARPGTRTNGSHNHGTRSAPQRKDSRKIKISSLSMEAVRFDQLTVRINEPYWMLHQGNCEHLFTIDEIRSLHPTDPNPNPNPTDDLSSHHNAHDPIKPRDDRDPTQAVNHPPAQTPAKMVTNPNPYPITSFLSRITSPKCRVCDRDPARMVTIDDELCSESPCFICFTCFKFLHAHEPIFVEPDDNRQYPDHRPDDRDHPLPSTEPKPTPLPPSSSHPNPPNQQHLNIRWGKVPGRQWWVVPLLGSN